MGRVIKTQCPKCARNGRDRSKDNLVTFPDGGAKCFSCGYIIPVELTVADIAKKLTSEVVAEPPEELNELPGDAHLGNYPPEVLSKIKEWGLLYQECIDYEVMWSPGLKWLLFPLYDQDSKYLGYMARNFKDGPKWVSRGKFATEIIRYRGPHWGNAVVITEDVVSAIKVARVIDTIPLLGTNLSYARRMFITTNYAQAIFWLDRDMFNKGMAYAKQTSALSGGDTEGYAIHTMEDPKAYDTAEIKATIMEAIGV